MTTTCLAIPSSEKAYFFGSSTIIGLVVWKTLTNEKFIPFTMKWIVASIMVYYAYVGVQNKS
jgi:hypothetical protein